MKISSYGRKLPGTCVDVLSAAGLPAPAAALAWLEEVAFPEPPDDEG